MSIATVLSAMSFLVIVLSTTTILLVPHADSLSPNPISRATRHSHTVLPPLLTKSSEKRTSSSSLLLAGASPTRSGRSARRHKNSNTNRNHNHNHNPNPASTPAIESRWQRAVRVEHRTQFALEDLQLHINLQNSTSDDKVVGRDNTRRQQQLSPTGKNTVIIRRRKSGVLSSVPSVTSSTTESGTNQHHHQQQQQQQQQQYTVTFPDIRECNSALAAFGDGGDLLRALRLFFKMRKATQLALEALSSSSKDDSTRTTLVPTPTLVTYSTLMSRAVSLGKPLVALRLWKVMRDQTDFFSYASHFSGGTPISSTTGTATATNNTPSSNVPSGPTIKASELKNLIVPDVKSANILMNTYAKLGDIDAAEDLMKQMQTKPILPQQEKQQKSRHSVVFGGGIDVPCLKPNLVTYNTLLDACQKTGEIDKALHWKSLLERESNQTTGGRNLATITYKNGKTRRIRLRPDARTYTILIGTVANKASSSYSYGTHDPSLAFQLLEEMKTKHNIAPNPLTYSALIDVCGRCKRSDLALKALRLMLRDERMLKQMKANGNNNNNNAKNNAMNSAWEQQQTVGAWTAAINACGKTGRIDTALKLFFVSMPRFKVKPNVITCSCLLDSLLKEGKTADSLEVLRYMKTHNLSPSEYIYTSFMNYASRLAGLEQNKQRNNRRYDQSQNLDDSNGATNRPWPSLSVSYTVDQEGENSSGSTETSYSSKNSKVDGNEGDPTKAVDIYSELMSILITPTAKKTQKRSPQSTTPAASNSTVSPFTAQETPVTTSNELYQVAMVFREMKASGVIPDLGSYNTLLRSCSNSGDIDRAQEVLKEILDPGNDLEPNDRTWRAVLRTAGKAKRSDIVLQTWKYAVADMGGGSNEKDSTPNRSGAKASSSSSPKKPKKRKSNNLSLQTFRTLLMALLICAWDLRESDRYTSIQLYKIIIKMYNALHSIQPEPSPASSDGPVLVQEATTTDLYMGMHLVDTKAAMENAQVLASILQAVVNLEYLLDPDDAWKEKLKQLGASIARAECLGNSGGNKRRSPSSLSFFDERALKTARRWY